MHGNGQIGWERKALQRIVALLLALADLAERAAGASHPARCLALCSLRHADAVARAFVIGSNCGAARTQYAPALVAVHDGFEPADAINLALSLRLLALVVQTIAAQRCLSSGQTSHDTWPDPRIAGAIQHLLNAAFPQAERRDTS